MLINENFSSLCHDEVATLACQELFDLRHEAVGMSQQLYGVKGHSRRALFHLHLTGTTFGRSKIEMGIAHGSDKWPTGSHTLAKIDGLKSVRTRHAGTSLVEPLHMDPRNELQ